MAETLLMIVRGAVALCCGAAGVVALTHWLIRQGTLSPFGPVARAVRGGSAWAVRPTERRLVGAGGNPQTAPYWLLGVTMVAGLVLLSFTQWAVGFLREGSYLAGQGWRGTLYFVVDRGCDLLVIALLVRAIGSWVGFGRWTRWMKPFYFLTDWIVTPFQRVIPPVNGLDLSTVAAWLAVIVVRALLLLALR